MPPGPSPDGEPSADLELVRDALSGKRAAVTAFLERLEFVPRMLSAQNRKLGRPLGREELEDVVQETLVAIWKKLEVYDGRAALETWIYPFGYFEFVRRLRGRRGEPRLLEDGLEGSAFEPEARVELKVVELEPLLAGLEALEAESAQVLRLKHFEDLTFDEIGARLGLPPSTVKTRYYKGLSRLRGRLGKTMAEADGGTS